MSQKREKVKLTDKQFELLRPRYQIGEQNVIGMLLDHIDVQKVEFDALVESADKLIDEKDARIKELERTLQMIADGEFFEEENAEVARNALKANRPG